MSRADELRAQGIAGRRFDAVDDRVFCPLCSREVSLEVVGEHLERDHGALPVVEPIDDTTEGGTDG